LDPVANFHSKDIGEWTGEGIQKEKKIIIKLSIVFGLVIISFLVELNETTSFFMSQSLLLKKYLRSNSSWN